jgi:hypothetical protein
VRGRAAGRREAGRLTRADDEVSLDPAYSPQSLSLADDRAGMDEL